MNEKIRNTPWLISLLTLTSVAALIVAADFFFHFYVDWNPNAVTAAVVIASLFVGVIAYLAAISKDNPKLSVKWIIIITVAAIALFNVFWVVCTFVCNNTLGLKKSGCVLVAFLFDGLLIGAIIGYSVKNYYKRYSKALIISTTAVIAVFSLAFSCIWITGGDGILNKIKMSGISYDWALEGVPEYEGGKLSRIYNSGKMSEFSYDEEDVSEDTLMQVAYKTDAKAFTAYGDKLLENGFTLVQKNTIEDNLFATYSGADFILHTYYTADRNEVRIIKDLDSVTADEFSYSSGVSGETTVYQYALYYEEHAKSHGKSEVCGMMYIIKLADNSLFVIDGGGYFQASDSVIDGLWDFCKEITGTQTGEKLKIASWFCTHAHRDHMEVFYKLLSVHSDEIDLERVMYNFPSFKETDEINVYESETTYALYRRLEKLAPDALLVKPHTGQTFTLDSLNIEVLYTHEDAFYPKTGEVDLDTFNDSSTVLKLSFDGKVFMLLGDVDSGGEKIINNSYGEETLRADIVQVAHHGYNTVAKLYNMIQAPIALYPQYRDKIFKNKESEVTEDAYSTSCNDSYKAVLKYASEDKIFFEGDDTVGITFVNGEAVITHRDFVGESTGYDGSPV